MRILVVEDEQKIAKALKKGLEQEGYAVDIAFDGEIGYDLASTEEYDVILLDLMLPKISGMEVCRKIRGDHNQTPVLMLTAKSQVEDRVAGLDCGADDYLTKPFALEELLARVRSLSRRPRNGLPSILEVEGLTLDSTLFEVKRADKAIELSKKEFALLEYLMRNAGHIVSKEQIISHVWDYEADILPNTVEVYIGYLRNKIDRPFAKKPRLLKTRRGFGYQLGGNR